MEGSIETNMKDTTPWETNTSNGVSFMSEKGKCLVATDAKLLNQNRLYNQNPWYQFFKKFRRLVIGGDGGTEVSWFLPRAGSHK